MILSGLRRLNSSPNREDGETSGAGDAGSDWGSTSVSVDDAMAESFEGLKKM